jgi:hypothetical protein
MSGGARHKQSCTNEADSHLLRSVKWIYWIKPSRDERIEGLIGLVNTRLSFEYQEPRYIDFKTATKHRPGYRPTFANTKALTMQELYVLDR